MITHFWSTIEDMTNSYSKTPPRYFDYDNRPVTLLRIDDIADRQDMKLTSGDRCLIRRMLYSLSWNCDFRSDCSLFTTVHCSLVIFRSLWGYITLGHYGDISLWRVFGEGFVSSPPHPSRPSSK